MAEKDQEQAEEARDLSKAQEASTSIHEEGVRAADRLQDGNVNEEEELASDED